MHKPFILTSRRVITQGGIRPAGIVVDGGRIRELLPAENLPESMPIQDFGNRVIMPGIIDAHVHINEPGRADWEGFESATKAAAAGGITTLMDMPLNSRPVTTTYPALDDKLRASDSKLMADTGFYGGLIPGNENQLEPLLSGGVFGIKAFLCPSGLDEFPASGEAELLSAMPQLAKKGLPLLVHAELPSTVQPPFGSARSYKSWMESRPEIWEVDAARMLIRLSRETGCRVHIVHLASARAAGVLAEARKEGLPISVETAPHYLYFSAENIPDGDARFKCAPPIRGNDNRDGLMQALLSGVIDFVATDHSPAPLSMKNRETGDLRTAWGGISSLQLLLPALWTAVRGQGRGIGQLANWLCKGPADFLGLDGVKGDIAPGYDADIVVWDPDETFVVDARKLHHRHPITPYDGEKLFGVVHSTYLRGQKIFDGERFAAAPPGRTLKSLTHQK